MHNFFSSYLGSKGRSTIKQNHEDPIDQQSVRVFAIHLAKEEKRLFENLNGGMINKTTFELDEESAFKIRDWANERLQQIGFDEHYQLTDDGEILEAIVDVLYE